MRIQLLANIRWTFFAYDETVTTPSRLIFTFAIFALHICNILMVQKEELFIKSPKLQINHAYNNKLKSRSFYIRNHANKRVGENFKRIYFNKKRI